jgi:hypothetical protein
MYFTYLITTKAINYFIFKNINFNFFKFIFNYFVYRQHIDILCLHKQNYTDKNRKKLNIVKVIGQRQDF